MSFFSGISDVFKGVTGALGDIASPIAGLLGFPEVSAALSGAGFMSDFGNIASGVGDFLGGGSGGSPFLSGIESLVGQRETNAANAKQAQKQMDFQERMSDTAYQRSTADLKKAGLNPMLAYAQGGASSPSGASATMQNSLGAGVSSAQQGEQVGAAVRQQHSQQDLNDALYMKAQNDSMLSKASAQQIQASMPGVTAQAKADAAEAKVKESLFTDPVGKGIMSAGDMIKNFFGPLGHSAATVQ